MGQMEAPSSWKIVKLLFLRKPGAEPKRGIRSYRAIALTSCITYSSYGTRKGPESWKKLHVGGIESIGCQHFQVMVTNLLQKHYFAALLRELAGLQGQVMFECVESTISLARCLRIGSVEAPRSWQKMAMQILAKVEEGGARKRMVVLLDSEG